MKTIRSVTVPQSPAGPRPGPGSAAAKRKSRHGCGGDGGCECVCQETCCSLECNVKPRFFCGQVLTDQDLDAMVSWAERRLGLSRYRDGWGVVCGLDVSCHSDSPTTVGVGAGYAVDCCGRDIVVCEPTSIDLGACCAEPEEPCADLDAYARKLEGDDEPRRVLVDLAIRHAETATDPRAALAQGSCGQVSVCENTRILEGHELVPSEGVPGGSPADAAVERWLEAWECCCEVVERFNERFGRALAERREKEAVDGDDEGRPRSDLDEPDPLADAIRRWLLAWIDRHPIQQLCLLREVICDIGIEQPLSQASLVAILFAIVQDCRAALALCPCPPCETKEGVPLARVCLETAGEKLPCRVISIDPFPPFRRTLSGDCCPAPSGYVNIGCVSWHRGHDACVILADRGVPARLPPKPGQLPRSFDELRALCKQSPFVPCGEAVCLQLIGDLEEICLGSDPRVIGWGPCADEPPPPPADAKPVVVDTRKDGPLEVKPSADSFAYTLGFACANPNPFAVELQVTDALPEPLIYAGDDSGLKPLVEGDRKVVWTFVIQAGQKLDRDWQVTVKFPPVRDTVTIDNVVTARATAPEADGRELGNHSTGPVQTVLLFAGGGTPPEPGPEEPRPPRPRGEVDDLTLIDAIGGSRRRVLAKAGIDSFEALAELPGTDLEALFPRAKKTLRDRWQREAARLARERR